MSDYKIANAIEAIQRFGVDTLRCEHIVSKLTQLVDGTSRPVKVVFFFTLIMAIPFIPHRKPRPQLPPLPPNVERVYLKAGDGKGSLELLIARPKVLVGDEENKAPLLFVHGGYGSAFCWKNWIPYFTSQGRTVYALSLSGHGYSTRPSFYTLRPKSYFAKDVLVALEHIATENKVLGLPPPVLVGHSAGGGLSQHIVDAHGAELRKRNHIGGLIGISPFPPRGGFSTFMNWSSIDSLVLVRTFLDPYLMLSTPRRVSRAFFGQSYCFSLHGTTDDSPRKQDTVPEGYMEQMTKEESVAWPNSMNYPFVSTHRVLRNMAFVGEPYQTRIHLVAGKQDVLMSPKLMERTQAYYACDLDLIEGAGHHLMLDAPWEKGAERVEAKLQAWGI